MKTATIRLGVAIGVIACIAIAHLIQAETTSTGRVAGCLVDVKTQKPLQFANIVILGASKGAMSLENGSFVIHGVAPGVYTVKAMMMGYKTVQRDSVVVHPDSTTFLEFQMVETIVVELQDILVTGERKRVDVSSSDVRASSENQLKELRVDWPPVHNDANAIARKTGVVMRTDDFGARGGRRGENGTQGATRGGRLGEIQARRSGRGGAAGPPAPSILVPGEPWNTESYDRIYENEFLEAIDNPYSTFSVDVDAASYSNVRRFIRSGHLPPPDAVRIEEMVNYFTYDYPEPAGAEPFSIVAETTECPWNEDNFLVHIGLQGRRLNLSNAPPANLVFLLDVSGSMEPPNKLPLLKKAFLMLVESLRDRDRVAIVVYASSAGVALSSTSGKEKKSIIQAIKNLHAGGSTAGGAGIELAYEIAMKNFVKGGNNRVILATDGDFNTGVSGDGAMVRLIEDKRESGVFLTVLGFGEANLKDSKLEKIADHGNGHYAYLDDVFEARKVLVNELGALFTIAKDVKIQVEFNPAKVKSYRLIGYENRLLRTEDFDDDGKDAGEIGAGHSVTALYEVVPADPHRAGAVQETSYVSVRIRSDALDTPELLQIRLRYKEPGDDESRLITRTLTDQKMNFKGAPRDFRFAVAVAEFGMLLRDSKCKGGSSYEHALDTAKQAMGGDAGGYRHEFVRLVEMCREMMKE